jgi:hypothetical protein
VVIIIMVWRRWTRIGMIGLGFEGRFHIAEPDGHRKAGRGAGAEEAGAGNA